MNKDWDFSTRIRIEIVSPKTTNHYSQIKFGNVPVKNLINLKVNERITATLYLTYTDFNKTFNDLQPIEGLDCTLIDKDFVEYPGKFKLILIHQHEEY